VRYLTPERDAPSPTETAVIASIPEAESLVGEHRRRLDAAAAWGVPAHVTVLGPFVPPTAINVQVIQTLAAVTAPVRSFDCRFAGTGWFGQDVLWLAPEPAEPFLQLTAAIWDAFPQYPPYGGAYDEVVPHLTVAERRLGDLAALLAAERAAQPALPFSVHIESLLLIAGAHAPSSWRIVHELPLG
jgi:2'-5' RNA ligase